MRTLAIHLTIGLLAALLSGCLGDEGPQAGQNAAALVKMEADELPEGLDTCSVYFERDREWEAPDALYGVKGKSDVVVFVQDGLALCQTPLALARTKLPQFVSGSLKLTSGAGDGSDPCGDSNPLPASEGENTPNSMQNPIGDSNPLPAVPGNSDYASDRGNRDDSNPLPARTGDSATTSINLVNGDSNPLPAHESGLDSEQSKLDDQDEDR